MKRVLLWLMVCAALMLLVGCNAAPPTVSDPASDDTVVMGEGAVTTSGTQEATVQTQTTATVPTTAVSTETTAASAADTTVVTTTRTTVEPEIDFSEFM